MYAEMYTKKTNIYGQHHLPFKMDIQSIVFSYNISAESRFFWVQVDYLPVLICALERGWWIPRHQLDM